VFFSSEVLFVFAWFLMLSRRNYGFPCMDSVVCFALLVGCFLVFLHRNCRLPFFSCFLMLLRRNYGFCMDSGVWVPHRCLKGF